MLASVSGGWDGLPAHPFTRSKAFRIAFRLLPVASELMLTIYIKILYGVKNVSPRCRRRPDPPPDRPAARRDAAGHAAAAGRGRRGAPEHGPPARQGARGGGGPDA